jgi:hypothetical protein
MSKNPLNSREDYEDMLFFAKTVITKIFVGTGSQPWLILVFTTSRPTRPPGESIAFTGRLVTTNVRALPLKNYAKKIIES